MTERVLPGLPGVEAASAPRLEDRAALPLLRETLRLRREGGEG